MKLFPIKRIIVPEKIPANKDIKVSVEGYLPNPAYYVSNLSIDLNDLPVIKVEIYISSKPGPTIQVIIDKVINVELPPLKPGTYILKINGIDKEIVVNNP